MSTPEDPSAAWSVAPLWGLSIPLPAVLMIVVGLYVLVLGLVLWSRYILMDLCGHGTCVCCEGPCPECHPFHQLSNICDCPAWSWRGVLGETCPTPTVPQCDWCDCACTCQPPECDSCNLLCCEIKFV